MKRLLLSNLILISIATATTLKVPSQYSTIQAAIDASSDGDTVSVSAGTYKENSKGKYRYCGVGKPDPCLWCRPVRRGFNAGLQ